MPTVDIPTDGTYRNIDKIELTDELYELFDGYKNEKGGINRRPGLLSLYDFGQGAAKIDGLYWWSNLSVLMVVTNGKTFKVARVGTTLTVTDLTGTALLVGNRVSFATDGTYVFMANGGQIIYTNGTATTAAIADGDAPTSVTHVAWIDGYLLANNSNNRFYFSNVNASLTWDALDFATASRNADTIVGLMVREQDVYLVGSLSVEIWQNDGESPFSPIAGGYLDTGCIAAQSITKTDRGIFWFSDERRFVKFSGRGVDRLSTPYDKVFDGLSSVSDAIGDAFEVDGKAFVSLTFPNANQTFIYNQNNETWSQWGAWQTSSGTYNRFSMRTFANAPDWGLKIVGSNLSSAIYTMSSDYTSDPLNPIRLAIKTGHLDFGRSLTKRGGEMRVRLKRGTGLSDRTPKLMFRYQDNGSERWSTEKQIDLGDLGETEIVKKIYPRGFFQTRQFEFIGTDAVPIIVARPEYDIDVLR